MQELGAPGLNDAIWLYGGDREEHRRAGHRAQARRDAGLGSAARAGDWIKMLTVYVHSPGRRASSRATWQRDSSAIISRIRRRRPAAGVARSIGGAGGSPLRGPRNGLSHGRSRPVRTIKWAVLIVLLAIYYLVPWLRWDRGPERARPGRAGRHGGPARLLLLDRDLAAGSLLPHRPADPGAPSGCSWSRPSSAASGAASPARRRSGPISSCRSSAGSRATATPRMRLDQAAVVAAQARPRGAKHGVWLLIALATGGAWIMYFNDAPTVVREIFTGQAGTAVYVFIAPVHRHHLCAGRLGARAGLHLHVPVAAVPGRDARRAQPRSSPTPTGAASRAAKPSAARAAGEPRRLHRLRTAASGLPDRHRHPRGPADGVHRLRPVHRCLQRDHGQGRSAARPDLIQLAGRPGAPLRAQGEAARAARSSGRAPSSMPTLLAARRLPACWSAC